MSISNEQALLIMKQSLEQFNARLQVGQSQAFQEISSLKLDLSEERPRNNPMKVSFPFTSVFVEDASDLGVYIRLIPESSDSGRDDIKLGLKDSFTFEYGTRSVYLYWPAQVGKELILKFFVTSKFQSGQLLLNQNSIPSTINFGHASAPNDGFSVIQYGQLGSTVTNGLTRLLNGCKGMNSKIFNTGTIELQDVGRYNPGMFQVPAGYEAELLAVRTIFGAASSWVAPRQAYITALKCKTYESEFDVIGSDEVDTFLIGHVDVVNGVHDTYHIPYVNNNGFTGVRDKIIAKEGETINMHINGSWTAGTLDVYFFIRLYRVVGA